ncbi:MAG TPA: LssY C-terminal domain-containing protein [Terriglobia bacterium]|nr:LssY C-terminal domain-containing protein [Terriglobia bacterium]
MSLRLPNVAGGRPQGKSVPELGLVMPKRLFSELFFRLTRHCTGWTGRAVRWLPAGALVWLLLTSAGLPARQAGQAGDQGPSGTPSTAVGGVPTHTVPSGTEIFLRLKTAVSTTSSHLNEPVEASTGREVEVNGEVAIPLGAVFSGRIARLIPSSSPTDRAKLLLQFNSLKLPGQAAVPLTCHMKEVDNAREKVLADGTIQGVLASELPVTLLNSAIAKIHKKTGDAQQTQQGAGTWFGNPDTSINYPVGTEFSVVLDKPLEVSGRFQPEFARQVPAALEASVMQVLAQAPRRVKSKKGNEGGPVNLVLVGSRQEIDAAFEKAGWTAAKDQDANSLWKTFEAIIKGQGYDAAPMSTLFMYGRPEDMAFEKMLNTFTHRHHLRIWKAPAPAADGRPVWLVVADRDNGFDIRPGVISHSVDPLVDLERAKVGADLGMTGLVAAEQTVSVSNPARSGLTATGGKWESDGRILVVDLRPLPPVPTT